MEMSRDGEYMTKRDFLEMTCLIFKDILNPQLVKLPIELAAVKLNIPDASKYVAGLLASGGKAAVPRAVAYGKEPTDKKEKGKRGLTAYNMFICWLSDFALHYGRHPTIAKHKAENPTLVGIRLCTSIYKSIPQSQKDALAEAFKPFVLEHGARGEADGSIVDAFKRYAAEHQVDVGKIVGLEAKPEYKTDPAQMKAEAAEARRNADGVITPATVFKTVGGTNNLNGTGQGHAAVVTPAAEAGVTPAADAKDEKHKRKREAAATATEAAPAAAHEPEPTARKKVKAEEEGEAKPKKEKKDKKDKSDVKVEIKHEEPAGVVGVKDSAVKKEKKKDKEKGDKPHKETRDKEEKKKDKKEKKEKKTPA